MYVEIKHLKMLFLNCILIHLTMFKKDMQTAKSITLKKPLLVKRGGRVGGGGVKYHCRLCSIVVPRHKNV
jgi:hypothetical protein